MTEEAQDQPAVEIVGHFSRALSLHSDEAMVPSHPLELPEVLGHVAQYLPKQSFLTCVFVSKAWHQVFVPLIWKYILLDDDNPVPPTALQDHSHLVKSLVINTTLTPELVSLRCPNLTSLSLRASLGSLDVTDFVVEHRLLTSLKLVKLTSSTYSSQFWKRLSRLEHLRDVSLSEVEMDDDDEVLDHFWQLCSQLERLEVRGLRIAQQQEQQESQEPQERYEPLEQLERQQEQHTNLGAWQFPRLKDFNFWTSNDNEALFFLELAQRCPNLTLFDWIDDERVGESSTSHFAHLVATGTWPHLHSLYLAAVDFTMDKLSQIIGGMQKIEDLGISCELLHPIFLDRIHPHFATLRSLDLVSGDRSISCVTQEILASCPSLEHISVRRMNATDIIAGKPWVCLRLRVLHASVCFKSSTLHEHQPLVLDRLATLTRLQELYMHGVRESGHTTGALDLRLEYGLAKLASLQSLYAITFRYSKQWMSDLEIDWMLEHWKCLSYVRGALHVDDAEIDKRLKEKLRGHGVRIDGISGK
ncbi:hypothetical protein BGX31_011376, partial [Mortierella sp. GBA43]